MTKFMNTRFRLTKNQKGMTLIELMAVVVILGILAAVAGAAVTGSFSKSKSGTDAASVRIITDAAQRYVMETNATEAPTLATLVSDGYLSSTPTVQSDSTKAFVISINNGVVSVAIE
ncbi:competence type IV pilus major pilin ComGC [Paenibacillus sp. YYML68]|uniref:competence type IV pilus major pilin ComGC n=1 Tax=Paenibacillus sp. YYML68 TaxID=2909250 RepID=UPI0024936C9B|nr:prepilin-type N-terminal cleavage/methylation domain-containing protein [Paenibacillus sp. YYML68]